MKVLHVAPLNVAGVPYLMTDMQRHFGVDATLVTLHRSALTFPEDICLHLPLPRNRLAHWWRDHKRGDPVPIVRYDQSPDSPTPVHTAKNIFEDVYFRYDDRRRERTVEEAIERFHLDRFDIIHYDGGMDFFRDSRIAQRWKKAGKHIICHYMGSDLRLRGVVPEMDALSDLNLTNESDHLLLHRDIHYIFIPFDTKPYTPVPRRTGRLRIVHSPTNRSMKGTAFLLPIMEEVKKVRDVEFVLIENTPHEEVIRIKQTCDIAIEQIGNLGGTGYGRNSLETLAMGMPTLTEITPDYLTWLPENPFVLVSRDTLYTTLLKIIDRPDEREELGEKGRAWVQKYHSYESVHARLEQLYREHNIL
jgi:glycosyltransferase involved in cell wall biosynthesis